MPGNDPHERAIEDASTTEGLPVAPSMGPALASVQAPRETVPVGPRVVLVSAVAIAIALAAGVIAVALTRLIGLVTNLAYYGRYSTEFSAPSIARLGAWSALVPVAGALCLAIGVLFGLPLLRLEPMHLAMATFALGAVLPGLARFRGLVE